MSPPTPPADVLQYLQEAAKGTGLPLAIVEAQNYAETGYGSNEGPSSAGAEGPWQFEPQTWASGGYSGSITSWADSTKAYISFMNSLLKQENGNVENALAAYNAGPGNIQAGMGYAQGIIAAAGGGTPSTDKGGSGSSGGGSGSGGDSSSGGVLDWLTGGLWSKLSDLLKIFHTLTQPSTYVRIACFFGGVILFMAAVYALMRANGEGAMPQMVPVPV
jgi:hypothetical protein